MAGCGTFLTTVVHGNRKLVVLVDDDDDTREIERFLLEAEGDFAVVTASDGRSALNLLDRIEPDVIVTDLVMPILDGFGFLREYRAQGGTVPILAASALEPYLDRALQMGADAILHKPFEAISFIDVVRGLCTGRERAEEPPAPHVAPETESQRLRAILALDLDQPTAEAGLEQFMKEVAAYFEVPTALISVVTMDRQFWTAGCGIPEDLVEARGTPREISFCTHAVAARAALIVQDTLDNPFFRDNVLVKTRGLRFYAGVPLISRHGEALGTLCLLDERARTFTHKDLELLTVFGRRVLATLEWREYSMTPIIPRSAFNHMEYLDRELQIFGAAGFRDLAIVEAARGIEAGIPVACVALAVPFRRLHEIVESLKARYLRSLIGRLGQARLGWIVPGHSAAQVREVALEIASTHSFAEAVDLSRYIGATRSVLYDLEQALGDAGLA